LAVWNPVYLQDTEIYNQNFKLDNFKFPFLYDVDRISDRVVIESS